MHPGKWLIDFALDHPRLVTAVMVGIAAVLIALVAAPSLAPDTFPMLSGVKVDTDPENMLDRDEPVRIFHNDMREVLSLYDMVVVGVVNDAHPNGVFNVQSLRNIYDLTEFARSLRGEALGVSDPRAGVIEVDLIAPSMVDSIEQGEPGTVTFEWLMPRPPETDEEALAVREKAMRIPFLNGTLVSEDGKAISLYLPLTSKDMSSRVYSKLQPMIAELEQRGGDDAYYVTGQPVAEDVFGVEMFKQMAISAPLAMLVIFLLMLFFFRKLILIISPMIIAMLAVIYTMGLLIATGNTIHIMSSMIPIFIMPIAVLDSIHILSEFFDRYQETRDRRKTISAVMASLFMPMLYTSLTSAAGFGSLALAPIPPVQVFGIFVALGVLLAWLFTVMFIPAFVMMLPERSLENFGAPAGHAEEAGAHTASGRLLRWMGRFAYRNAKAVIAASVVLAVVAAYGISLIEVNDNPTKWFRKSHPIRVADRVLNEHFGGTYMAYLALSPEGEQAKPMEQAEEAEEEPTDAPDLPSGLGGEEPGLPAGLGGEEPGLPAGLGGTPSAAPTAAPTSSEPEALEIFKDPGVLAYINRMQAALVETEAVGKSNSLADIVRTVHRDLIDGTEASYRIPDSASAVAQCLMQYQSSHRPGDLWHFVTPDYRHTSVWVQLRSGDNVDMQRVVEAMEAFFAENPPVFEIAGETVRLEPQWFGKTYINVVWQEKMVTGMLMSFLGSFFVVLLMMTVLFRSGLWGLLSMIPLTLTIALIYGVLGLIGKDYDMPVAVLSSLTLGLAVDFAIHFMARSRELQRENGSWKDTYALAFGEPARAILRNVIVIAVGFTPLLFAPLVPYNTVGVFLASILLISGVATLLLLSSLIRLLEPLLFPKTRVCSITCRCGTCILTAVTAVLVVWVNVVQFISKGVTQFTIVSIIALPILMLGCFLASRRAACRTREALCETED